MIRSTGCQEMVMAIAGSLIGAGGAWAPLALDASKSSRTTTDSFQGREARHAQTP